MGDLLRGPWSGEDLYNLPKFLVAREEGVSVRTVDRWLRDECPHKILNGHPRFCLASLREWRAEQERKAS